MERREIVEMWRQGRGAVLVTLVRTEGSSYRRPGARLLLGAEGAYAGTISGGCLEAELVRRAVWKSRNGAVVERYSTAFDDTAEIPFGLGCGGELDLLLEPAGTPEYDALLEVMAGALEGRAARVATWLPDGERQLERVVWDACGLEVFRSAEMSAPRDEAEAFVEQMAPPQRLLVFGAGDDAKPVASLANMLGWTVVVVDGRAQLARGDRFAGAERVMVGRPEGGLVEAIGVSERDAVVLMTHSYEQDRGWLERLLPIAPRYLGLLGARHRSSLMVSEVATTLGWTVAACCERLHAPVGLDLGGDGAEAIALAVIAEVHACVEGKAAGSRRLRAEDVAEQVARGGISQYLRAQCALDGAA